MKYPPLTVIEASAGTGKTFALVTRLMALIFDGVEPERIVALTFSRMAAGEIFNSFIERLSKAAGSDEAAKAESERLGKEISRAGFAGMLRKVISRQHLSLIGTLDSFMMKVARSVSLELGLEGDISIMSDYRSPVERLRLVGEMLLRESGDTKEIFREAFRLASGGAGARGFAESFSSFIGEWHGRYRDFREREPCAGLSEAEALSRLAAAWGDAGRIWGDNPPEGLDAKLSGIRALADGLAEYAGKRGADSFIAAVREFGGEVPKIPKVMADDPLACDAAAKMRAWAIGAALRSTRGIFILVHAYESAYAAKVRSRALVAFDDLPRLVNALEGVARLPLEYRMDAKFDHWALDEFQDTSRGQWNALGNIISEAGSPGAGKSVLIVGDRKQSVYSWRGGDVEVLGEQVEKASAPGNRLKSLDESRRYVKTISDAVNRVFGEATVRGLFDMDDAPESAKWKCREHSSFDRETSGFVQVLEAVKKGKQAKGSDFFEPISNALAAVKPWERGISTAILVRNNALGEAVLGHLKSVGIGKCVYEGERGISDSPVLAGMTELVRLAEHSGDSFAYAHIAASPLAAALHPEGLPGAAELSAELLADFTRLGMARFFREVREKLKSVPGTWNDFAESRFEDFIKCAAEFEAMRDATMRLSDFAEFVSKKTRRDFAEPGMVRIMTMHQSKGLGFDWVIIPFYEHDKLSASRHCGALEHDNPAWVVKNPGAEVARGNPELSAALRAWEQRQTYDALCLDYVAMTRAKRALTLILHPANKTPPQTPEKFSDLVRMVGLETSGDPAWYRSVASPPARNRVRQIAPPSRGPRRPVQKSRPSESFFQGLRADALFAGDFGAAAKRGVEAHARYQGIEWASREELAKLPVQFRPAFERQSIADSVWRERPYELFADGKWETGQFDRVVFRNGGERAVIYDFKTNAARNGEDAETFAGRMRQSYSGQLCSYRRALAALTGIPDGRIEAFLLLEATGAAVAV